MLPFNRVEKEYDHITNSSSRSLRLDHLLNEAFSEALETKDLIQSTIPVSPTNNSNDDWLDLWMDENWETQTLFDQNMTLIRLHDETSIRKAANLHRVTVGGGNRRLHHRHDKTRKQSSFVKGYPHLQVAPDNDYGSRGRRKRQRQETDAFDKYLNWASDQNPDGVNIVHSAHDQGSCGSCWGWAATGTLEASASRRIAFQTYQTVVQRTNRKTNARKRSLRQSQRRNTNKIQVVDDETHNHAVMLARVAEQQAIGVAQLSVQELVDCDTFADQGCTGGNPLLAFYYIHRYGLTSATQYPYTGLEEVCQMDLVSSPIATVQSWGILTTNHEDNMESVLRQLGPIAVGVDGADSAFMSYSGGIFESTDCGQTANHALLVVGYGSQVDKRGRTVRYWIARNSWGSGWGENGFVRIRRGSGRKGEEGVCGIAKSPSVALGGVLLTQSGIQSMGVTYEVGDDLEKIQRIETSLLNSYCDSFGLEDVEVCGRFERFFASHTMLLYCVVSLLVSVAMVVFSFTNGCRIRRRTHPRQAERADRSQEHDESTPFLRLDYTPETYGAGT